MRAVLGQAVRHRPFLVMSGAYFVCGLNLVFLTTHLPTYLAICGQDPLLSAEAIAVIGGMNSVGSITAGWLGGKYPKHILLGLLYILRAFVFTAYFVMPPTPASTLLFAAAMGMLWLSVAPLVSGLVAEMFGTRYMATLLGIAFVMHQVGSSLGAWGGGMIFDKIRLLRSRLAYRRADRLRGRRRSDPGGWADPQARSHSIAPVCDHLSGAIRL